MTRRHITAITANTLRILLRDMNPVLRQYVSHEQTHKSFMIKIHPTFENRIGISAISAWLLRLYRSIRTEFAKQPLLGRHVGATVDIAHGELVGIYVMY